MIVCAAGIPTTAAAVGAWPLAAPDIRRAKKPARPYLPAGNHPVEGIFQSGDGRQTTGEKMSRTFWLRIGIGLIVLAGAVALYQIIVSLVPHPLPVYMTLPELTLTDQDGQTYDLNQTRGKVVVLSLVYTHCPDICPLTTAKMRQIQQQVHVAGLDSQVQLVTFTVDPARDTPAVIKQFAGLFNADPSNWVFLTGTIRSN